MTSLEEPLNIRTLLAQRDLETHFQPITSIRRQSVLGMEALSRGRNDGGLIPPDLLFAEAHSQNLTSELDSLCRDKAIESFAPLGQEQNNLMLFVNLHPSALRTQKDVDALQQSVQKAGLEANRVVIELLEVAFDALEDAMELVTRLREAGFLIALDDMGAGHSNLDRVAQIRPDILKADRSLVANIEHDYVAREVFKSLVLLSERVGGWLVAEGVETPGQALAILEMGGDIMQGYYFARPALLSAPSLPSVPAISECGQAFKEHTLGRVQSNRRRYDSRLETINSLLKTMRRTPRSEFGERLKQRSSEFARVESACVLDEEGVQICDAVLFAPSPFQPQKSVIFAPPAQGTDHSFKEYFYLLSEARLNPFVTQPYVPLPSQDLCVTISTLMRDAEGKSCILVVHFHADPEELGRIDPVGGIGE